MIERTIEVEFKGAVTVHVPDHLADKDADSIAALFVKARILATMENPDSAECEVMALEDFCDECEHPETSEQDWDAIKIHGVAGQWTVKTKK